MKSKTERSIDSLFFGLLSFFLGLLSLRIAMDPNLKTQFLVLTFLFWITSFVLLMNHFTLEKTTQESQQ